jgi:hypothetical protein
MLVRTNLKPEVNLKVTIPLSQNVNLEFCDEKRNYYVSSVALLGLHVRGCANIAGNSST